MLGVEDHFIDPLLHIGDGVGDDLQIGLLADAQVVAYMQVPSLANQSHHRGIGFEQHSKIEILRWLDADLHGRAEGRHLGVLELEFFDALEKIGVAVVGAGITAFDVIDAEFVQFRGDAQLVLERKRNIFGLAAVSQGRVVKQNIFHNFL